jgi:hypothetical protein
MIRILCLALIAGSAFGGQSVNLKGRYFGNSSFPSRSSAQPWRVELYIHDWDDNVGTTKIANLPALGMELNLSNIGDGRPFLWPVMGWNGGEAGDACQIRIHTLPSKQLYLRYQRDPEKMQASCEAWDGEGNLFYSGIKTFTSNLSSNSSGIFLGAYWKTDTPNLFVSFLRIHSTVVPLNSRPPVHRDDANRLLEWKLDGNLNDASGNGWTITSQEGPGGSVTYGTTTGQDRPIAKPKTFNAPFWTDWVSLRAGFPNQLDGRASYSQADASPDVSHFWTQISGPSTLRWDSRTSATPTITGAVFGNYRFRLTITDAANQTATRDLDVGAVAMDENGVVIHADPNVEKIFGPMIAFGRNPWGYADDAHLRGMKLRRTTYLNSPPVWETPQPGTVATVLGNVTRANLAAAISPTDTTIVVNSTANLDLATFPVVIGLGVIGYGGEEVLICSASGTTLTVCFNGRGYNNGNPQAWGAGAAVKQYHLRGTGTAFVNVFCPAGPGVTGRIVYNAGTVTATAGSTTLTGDGTAWTSGNGVYAGFDVKINGTYAGGTPFEFVSRIASIQSPSSVTLTRAFPEGADTAAGLSYAFLNRSTRNLVVRWTRPDQTQGYGVFGLTSCNNDTSLNFSGGLEVVQGSYSETTYSYMDHWWATNSGVGDINFYDEVLANYSLYYRSGLAEAQEAARLVGDHWVKNPTMDEGYGFHWLTPRNVGLTGVIANTVLDKRTENWYAIRRWAARGVQLASSGCDGSDTRDNAYQHSWLALAALFDPDEGQRSTWKNALNTQLTRDQNCKRDDNSFSTAFYWNASRPATATQGSATLTSSGAFNPSWCNTVANGSGTITAGSPVIISTAAIPAGGKSIFIQGTRGGQVFMQGYEYSGSGTTVHLSALWPGDTGEVQWYVQSSQDVMIVTLGNTDTDEEMNQVWACTYVDANTLTLSRPWTRASGRVYLYRSNVAGRGVQPYFGGIKISALQWSQFAAEGSTADGFGVLKGDHATWIAQNGYDPNTGGFHYARKAANCEPTVSLNGGFYNSTIGCSYGTSGKEASRGLVAEALPAYRAWYEKAPTSETRAQGDVVYGNLYGVSAYTRQGFPVADTNRNTYLWDGGLAGGKWYGFHFGIGMGHQWPAVRQGGAQPPLPQSVSVNFDLAGVPEAVAARVLVLEPSGAQRFYRCTAAPCQIEFDRRQGAPWIRTDYLGAGDVVLRMTEPDLLSIP